MKTFSPSFNNVSSCCRKQKISWAKNMLKLNWISICYHGTNFWIFFHSNFLPPFLQHFLNHRSIHWDWVPQLFILIDCGFFVIVFICYKEIFPWWVMTATCIWGIKTNIYNVVGDYTGLVVVAEHFPPRSMTGLGMLVGIQYQSQL